MGKRAFVRWGTCIVLPLATTAIASCSSGEDNKSLDAVDASAAVQSGMTPQNASRTPPDKPNYVAGPVDTSELVVQRNPLVGIAKPGSSRAFRDLPSEFPERDGDDERERIRAPGLSPFEFAPHPGADMVRQSDLPRQSMPVTLQSFIGQGQTLGGCIFPRPDGGVEPGTCTTQGDPPDTVGAVGPNHYVQTVNSGVAMWNKSGTLVAGPKYTNNLFVGIDKTNGNRCDAPPAKTKADTGGDWGDAVVLYDQLADRWVITQFDITNGVSATPSPPSYQCVAVSKTGDPTGEYWLYSFQYNVQINDYGKFSTWPDAYYASFNNFDPTFVGANLCAYDRLSMLQGKTATQQCFTNNGFGFLPSNVDGQIKPPDGEPAFFVTLSSATKIGLYKFHTDWTTPANSTFTGPTSLTVSSYAKLCNGGNCVVQPSPGNALASLGDRPMFHLSYRNFGTLESLVFNHSVSANGAGGVRWYEIRSPNATPTVFQQGTYAPNDGNYRWMGSIAQDQAQDIALGFALSGSSTNPSIGWTGRLASDPGGTMGQGESIIQPGGGVETGTFSNGSLAQRFGDYSNMTVDPTDDCTFWYTQEAYPANGIFNWDTHVSSVRFPGCAQNDFTISLTPSAQSIAQGSTATFTVSTAVKAGTAESIALVAQDLPSGVTGAFSPTTVNAGGTSTLTLTATAAAPITTTPANVMVIGKATSAVHPVSAQLSVVAPGNKCGNGTVDPGESCDDGAKNGTSGDCCSSTCTFQSSSTVCRPSAGVCDVAESCTGSSATCPADGHAPNGTACPGGTCTNGVCVASPPDAGVDSGAADSGTPDAGVKDAAADTGAADSGAPDTGAADTGAPDSSVADSSADDSGFADDSSAPDSSAGNDSGVALHDSGSSGGDDSGDDAGDDGGSGTSGDSGGDNGGCGCRTVASANGTSGWAIAGLAGLGIALARRRRSRR